MLALMKDATRDGDNQQMEEIHTENREREVPEERSRLRARRAGRKTTIQEHAKNLAKRKEELRSRVVRRSKRIEKRKE